MENHVESAIETANRIITVKRPLLPAKEAERAALPEAKHFSTFQVPQAARPTQTSICKKASLGASCAAKTPRGFNINGKMPADASNTLSITPWHHLESHESEAAD